MNPFDEIRANLEQRLRSEGQKIEAEIASHEQALVELKAKQEGLPSQILRASQKLPDNAYCPTCWILDGDQVLATRRALQAENPRPLHQRDNQRQMQPPSPGRYRQPERGQACQPRLSTVG